MSPAIQVQWIGHRKDASNRGAVMGWFVQSGHSTTPAYRWTSPSQLDHTEHIAYMFWGRIGNTLHIVERELTPEFLHEMNSKAKNFKQVDPQKIMSKWGKTFTDDLNMHIMMMKLKS